MTPYTKQIVELHKIHKAIENCGCNKDDDGQGGGDEKIAFEDWKRNPYAFPMVNMIDFAKNGQDIEFSINSINPKHFGYLGGFVLGISDDYIRDSELTVNEFFNINDENFVLVANDDNHFPDLILSNDNWINSREEQFNINSGESYNAFYTKHDLYKLPIVSNNSIEYGLIKIVSKDNPDFIFYTTYQNTFGGHD